MGDFDKPPKTAILMECFKVKSEDLHPRFVEYDTAYLTKNKNGWEYYKLPPGDCIVLLLKSYVWNSDLGDTVPFIWTTIRRYTPEKYAYYLHNRNEEFIVKVIEDD
jgi:hypothetical protein